MSASVVHAYRNLATLIRRLPKDQQPAALSQLRNGFRKNANEKQADVVSDLLVEAEKKASFLRIVTPMKQTTTTNNGGITTYVYKKNGEIVEENARGRDRKSRVHTNWDGRNMDPCAVKRHNAGLRRAGFVNNTHAKGIF
mmetsp:Transcript_17876/g.25444  ORF Transcript_17876/g.25444 Transcript_17876/m.25444 type:complete len:140 (+) Transcript_17876:69-488(+)